MWLQSPLTSAATVAPPSCWPMATEWVCYVLWTLNLTPCAPPRLALWSMWPASLLGRLRAWQEPTMTCLCNPRCHPSPPPTPLHVPVPFPVELDNCMHLNVAKDLQCGTVERLQRMLHSCKPFVQRFKAMNMADFGPHVHIVLHADDGMYYYARSACTLVDPAVFRKNPLVLGFCNSGCLQVAHPQYTASF